MPCEPELCIACEVPGAVFPTSHEAGRTNLDRTHVGPRSCYGPVVFPSGGSAMRNVIVAYGQRTIRLVPAAKCNLLLCNLQSTHTLQKEPFRLPSRSGSRPFDLVRHAGVGGGRFMGCVITGARWQVCGACAGRNLIVPGNGSLTSLSLLSIRLQPSWQNGGS